MSSKREKAKLAEILNREAMVESECNKVRLAMVTMLTGGVPPLRVALLIASSLGRAQEIVATL
jgi:hypothetical protein